LNKYFVPPRNHLGRMRFMNHAEAHALIAAHEMLGTLPSKVTIYVDRITCPFCRNELKYLLKELQIEELKIVNSLTDEILILNPTK
jgi:deoxycytidylate deaminase